MPIRSCPGGFRFIPAAMLVALLLSGATAAAAPDPDKVGGPESCAECHIQEIEVWKQSVHFKTFNEMHRRPETTAMLGKLGLGPMKQQQQCMDCHYLNRSVDQKIQPTSGIACESCHSAGRDWAQTHGDYGKGVTKATESATHRAARVAQALGAGMITHDNIYALGSACYGCHLMNDEKIVNVGGHSTSSAGFNLLTWSQGEVRHTVLYNDNTANPEATPARRRQLFVVGVILETEFGFRAVARATTNAKFGVSLARQTDAARKLLEKIQALAPTPELAAIIGTAAATKLRLNNADELNQAADKISALGREFAAKVTGEQLAGLDALVPDATHYRGKPYLLRRTLTRVGPPMAKSSSRPAIQPGSQAPYTQATRQAGPERWDKPFSPDMKEVDVDLMMAHPIFYNTAPEKFPAAIPLRGILRNDTRLHQYLSGEIIVRRGDYGHSAFIIMDGAVKVLAKEPPAELLGRQPSVRPSVWGSFKRWLSRPNYAETATRRGPPPGLHVGRGGETRIFLQDVPGVLETDRTIILREGELFGEIAALGRTPRTATVVAEGEVLLLEIRWQGLREIRKYSPAWKERIDGRYRERSLKRHLAETPLMWNLSDTTLQLIADATRFETFGEFDWHSSYQRMREASARELMEKEPLIAREGDYPNGLLLVRSGFARVSRRYNHGERTESYLGKGQVFGLHEIVTGWRGQHVALRHSLRALGYVDLLFIPTAVIEQHVLPALTPEQLAALTLPAETPGGAGADELVEFMVAQRFINGRATMLIDLDRCTRCDDCVRACAATHDNNPRFIRQGPEASGVMVASACMHCVDPVCMIGCPTGAIYRENIEGLVGIDADTCIGCSICANSCPYGTIQMVALHDEEGLPVVTEETGAPIRRATKCDLCIDLPGGPACVSACPHDALVRADMRAGGKLTDWLKR